MKIQTTKFGEIDIEESSCFEMISPILGYDNEKKFALIEHGDNSSFKWFQSLKTPDLAFVVSLAGLFGIDYAYELPEDIQEKLEIKAVEDVLTVNVVVIPQGKPQETTINLLAPLVFNVGTKKGAQIILTGTDYTVDYPIFKQEALC